MKAIEPVSIWVNGAVKQANKLNLYVVNDDLKSNCTFYYSLLNETETSIPGVPVINEDGDEIVPEPTVTVSSEMLTQGNLTMNGQDYENWNIEEEINDAAYTWAVGKLGLTLI